VPIHRSVPISITRCVSCDEDEIARVPERVMLSQLSAADRPYSRYQDRILSKQTQAVMNCATGRGGGRKDSASVRIVPRDCTVCFVHGMNVTHGCFAYGLAPPPVYH